MVTLLDAFTSLLLEQNLCGMGCSQDRCPSNHPTNSIRALLIGHPARSQILPKQNILPTRFLCLPPVWLSILSKKQWEKMTETAYLTEYMQMLIVI